MLIAVTACLLLGCGYHFGARLPEDIASLQVPIFGNSTLIRGIEFELTEALTHDLKSRTSARLVDDGADAVLSGSVASYRKVPVYESGGEVIAGRITLTVLFRLAKSTPDQPVVEGSETETQDYDTRTGVTETDARREAVREIARKIVSRIEAW
jgi:hypothetical protein